jgi:septum formation protein
MPSQPGARPRLILASTSRYRSALLARLGLPFETCAPDIDESAPDDEDAVLLSQRLASGKAAKVLDGIADGAAIVIAADQTAALGGRLLRKPGTRDAAIDQLAACQGRSVLFHTAVTIVDTRSGSSRQHLATTEVRFRQRSRTELGRYVDLEQPLDCAGGFKAEGLGIALFESIESDDPTALIGLPLIWVSQALAELGLDPLAPLTDAGS